MYTLLTVAKELVSRLSIEDPVTSNGVLQVAHSIFKRWRPLFRSDDLFTEINHVQVAFGSPFLNLLASTNNTISQGPSNKAVLEQHMTVLNTSIKVLHDLTCQDIPQIVVDNLDDLVALLDKYLKFENASLDSGDDTEAGLVEYVKAGVFELLTLWAQKYEEDITNYIGGLIETSWNLLTSLGPETKNDLLASRAMGFLTSVTKFATHARNFNNEATLKQVIEKAVLPNIALREADVELFEDEPIEYIRRDLEGADSETRRRAATDFLRQLMEQFQQLVTELTLQYIQHFMQEHTKDPAGNWQAKDTAIYLFCSIAATGAVTGAEGVKTTNPHVNIIEFFQQHVAQDLVNTPSHIILQVDAIKFLYMFRSRLSREHWAQAFPLLVKHLGAENYVAHTYCSIAVERTLALNAEDSKPMVAREQVQPTANETLRQLFKLVTKDSAAEKIQENEFLMRCIMRILVVIRDGALPFVDFLLTSFTNITRLIRHNPSNPRFYYYMFESIGAMVRFCAPQQPQKLENTLYEPFAAVLQEQVVEFMPYVFQLFAALLEANPSEGLSEFYTTLITPILNISLWEQRGNAPALTRLLSALIRRGSAVIVQNDQILPVLGVFQHLIASKSTEASAFDLLETCIESFPHDYLKAHYGQIFQLLLTRLMSSKTEQLSLRFVRLYHLMASKPASSGLGVDSTAAIIETVQQGLYTNIYLNVILPETQKLSRPFDKKLAVVSFTKTLTDSQAFATRYTKGWGLTVEALLKLLINPPLPPAQDDIIAEQDVEDSAFGVGFTALSTCKRPLQDPFPDVVDAKVWVEKHLADAAAANPSIAEFVQQRLSDETRNAFVRYMQGS